MQPKQFLEVLYRDDPKELLEYIMEKGKAKPVSPFIDLDDIPEQVNQTDHKEEVK